MDDVCTGVRIGGSLRLVPGDGVERALGDDGDVAAATQQRRDRFRAGELVRFRRCVLSGEAGERGNDLRERWVSCGGGEDGVADPFALDFPACDELPGWEEFVDGALAGGVHVGVDAAVPVEDLVPGDVGPVLPDRVRRDQVGGTVVEVLVVQVERGDRFLIPQEVVPVGVLLTPGLGHAVEMLRAGWADPDLVEDHSPSLWIGHESQPSGRVQYGQGSMLASSCSLASRAWWLGRHRGGQTTQQPARRMLDLTFHPTCRVPVGDQVGSDHSTTWAWLRLCAARPAADL